MNNALPRSRWNYPLTFLCLLLYLAMLAWAQLHHELWGDEIHSWNISKASVSLSDLFRNIRYEGHPPLWYILLWLLSKVTHDPQAIQLLQFAIASFTIVLLLFRSPFPPLAKALLPFGYFLLYEYGCLSRNYALAICLAFALLILIREKKEDSRWFYPLLFLLANTHLLGILLAISIHAFTLMTYWNAATVKVKWKHTVLGLIAVVPAFIFIMPPDDSELNLWFWMKIWNTDLPRYVANAPLRSLLPLPVWWDLHFWNTHFLLRAAEQSGLSKLLVYGGSLGLFTIAIVVLKNDRNALRMFLLNAALTALIGLWFPMTSARYIGFLFIGFIAALWLHRSVSEFTLKRQPLLYLLLAIQLPGTFVALYRDGSTVFSNASQVKLLAAQVPANASLATDYNALNPLLTFLDRPFYCLEAKRELSFVQWTDELTKLAATSNPYEQGTKFFQNEQGITTFYLMSSLSPDALRKADTAFCNVYQPRPVDSLTGAIEKYSNYYLYRVGH